MGGSFCREASLCLPKDRVLPSFSLLRLWHRPCIRLAEKRLSWWEDTMSIFSALTTAVTGLTAQTRSMGAISDNLANQTTVGYKRVTSQFQSMVTASSTSSHSPGGVRVTPMRDTFQQGTMQQSSVPTNIAINGDGYFNVCKAITRNDGKTSFEDNYFTRAGDFTLDKNGYLVNSAGYYLTGQKVDSTTMGTDPNTQPIQVNRMRDMPLQTTEVKYSANLPASPTSDNDIDADLTNGIQFSANQTSLYDPLGSERKMTMSWTKLPPSGATPDTNAGIWKVDVSLAGQAGVQLSPDGGVTNTAADAPLTLYVGFNTTGANVGTIAWVNTTNAAPAPLPTGQALQNIQVSDASGASWDFDLNLGTFGALGGLTQYASDTIDMSKVEQNGVPIGSLKSMSFDKDGYLTLNYDNGRSIPVYRVPIAMFSAPQALAAESGTAFRATWESGDPTLVFPGGLSSGEIVPTTLEMSNVDISDEFTKMIVSQRTYSANTKMLTVSDEMLQEILAVAR